MFKLFKIVEEVDSPVNGKIQVVKDLSGARIIAGGVSQSGWLVKSVWNKALKKVTSNKKQVARVLILGLGGGSAAEVVAKYWPGAEIIGVDIDPEMVRLGKKYLQLGKVSNLGTVIADAEGFLASRTKRNEQKFDLVLIDLFNGSKIPAKFYTDSFIKLTKSVLSPGGVVAFNHLYSHYEKETVLKLQKKLRKNFVTVTSVLPEANIVFICFSK